MPTLKIPISAEDHIQGSSSALITLVEYGDYECPFCGRAYATIKQIQQHFGEKLRFVFRNFPMSKVHPHAMEFAEAAEFAAQHNYFWQMHDLIYENQSKMSHARLLELTESLGLSAKELERALAEKTFEQKVHEDFLGGVKSGVNGTPTFYINENRHNGAFEFQDLVSAIQNVMAFIK